MSGSLPSREAFTAQYRSLAVDERGAFVAALQAARGWETTVEGAVVVAKRNGVVRRIAVGQPGEDTTVDAVVADDDGLRSFAEDRDAEVLEPEALREELFYGLDTEKGVELFGTHFDGADIEPADGTDGSSEARESGAGDPPGFQGRETSSLSSKPRNRTAVGRSGRGFDSEQTGTDGQGAGSGGDSDRTDGVVSLATVLTAGVVLVLLFFLASGSGAVAVSDLLSGGDGIETGDAGEQTGTSDNSTTGSETDATGGSGGEQESWNSTTSTGDGPPLRNGTYDADQIAETHAAAIEGYDSFRFRVQSEGPADVGAIEPPRDLDVRIAGDNRFLVEEEDIGSGSGESVSIDVFADGYLEYWRFDGPAGVRYNRGSIRIAPTVTGWSGEYGAKLIRTYLNASNSTTDRVLVDSRTAYRITVNSPPPALDGEAVGYRATATVMSDGTVRTLTVTYRHEPSGEEVWLRLQYDIGEREIGTPIWYDRALEQFDHYGP